MLPPHAHACMHAGETYYDILGVDVDADEDEIRSAYRRRAKELHPDVNREVCQPLRHAMPCHAGPHSAAELLRVTAMPGRAGHGALQLCALRPLTSADLLLHSAWHVAACCTSAHAGSIT